MENEYLQLLSDVLRNGEVREDRTGTGTISVFGRQIRCDLGKGFPAVTSKKLFWDGVVGELLWFLEGSSSNARLAELTYGDHTKDTIWTGNATSDSWKNKARFRGDVGDIYGVQWRRWRSTRILGYSDYLNHDTTPRATTYFDAKAQVTEIDQIANLVHTIKTNPTDRRMILSAFNVGELDLMSLPPCHMFAQFYVSKDKKLSCQVYMRSVDTFLGLPFNIASYALLTHMLAQVTDLGVGELMITMGDTHIYSNHVNQVKQQLLNHPFDAPTLRLNPEVKCIDDFKKSDIVLEGYKSYPAIKAVMAV